MWDELYRRYVLELTKYASAACGDMELAQDLVQDTFLKALQNADTFLDLGPSQMRAWLYRTMKRLLIDRYRRAVLEMEYANSLEDGIYLEPGLQRVENEQVLCQLPETDRAVFTLRYLQGYNASEISEMLGLPPGTIRAKLSRSRKYLKLILEE